MHVLSLGPATARWSGMRLLQDSSYVSCNPRASLALLSIVRHGQTWYERHGFAATQGARALRAGNQSKELSVEL